MRPWLLLVSLFCAAAFGQQAYRWTDENGQVHYSDRPAPGATQIELRGAQGYSPAVQPRAQQAAAESSQPTVREYTAFNVISPAQQETLWNIGAVLNVQVELEPGLQPGHHLGAYLDGQLIDVRATTTQFQLPDVFRGTHTLQAVVLDASGEELLRSLAVTFMVMQTSLQNPNNPNAPAAPSAPNRPTPNRS